MILSGKKIWDEVNAGNIAISDFDPKRLNPNSYNLRLNNQLLVYTDDPLDMKKPNRYTEFISNAAFYLAEPIQKLPALMAATEE